MIRWIKIINTTGMKWLGVFHIDDHRINNTGWMMKWRWNGGVERKAKLLGECWTFFNLHFPAPVMEAMSRICACKTEKNLQIFGWCLQFKQSCLWATLILILSAKTKQENQRNEASRLRKCIKRAQRYHSHGMRKSLFANWIYYIAAKKPQPLCETGTKRELEKQGNAATG